MLIGPLVDYRDRRQADPAISFQVKLVFVRVLHISLLYIYGVVV